MAIKSAIMTTAYQTTRSGPSPGQEFGKPFDFGAGHVDPTAALQPGLVLDSSNRDWQRFICGSGEVSPTQCPAECRSNAGLCEPINLNTPSILVARLASTKTVTRTLTSVLTVPATFKVSSIVKPAGFEVVVQPSSFNLNPGSSIVVHITISWSVGVEYQQYQDGSITWTSDSNTTTRIPVVVSASYLAAPPELQVVSRTPTLTYPVTPGFTGTLSTVVMGLQQARVFQGTVSQVNPFAYFEDDDPTNQQATSVSVSLPASASRFVRVALYASDYPEGTNLDLYVYDSKSENLLGYSLNAFSDEVVSLQNPSETGLTIFIQGPFVPGGSVTFKLYVWMLNQPGPASSNTVSKPTSNRPLQVTKGYPTSVTLSFNSRLLSTSQKWLGIVRYAGDAVDDGKVGLVPLPEYDTLVNFV
jgi:hypothetical protein